MSGFALLWGKILRSSLWVQESKETRLVWITLLALRNEDGVVQCSEIGLADAAKVSAKECKEALKVLLDRDPNDSSGVEDGRRLRVVPGGWQIVNHDLYRFSTEAKREFWRQQKAEQREKIEKEKEKKKRKFSQPGKPLPGEQEYERKLKDGLIDADGVPISENGHSDVTTPEPPV